MQKFNRFVLNYSCNYMASAVCVIGSSNTDMVIKADKLPAPGETVIGGTFLMNPGGKGANQAVAAARLAVPMPGSGRQEATAITFVANVGNDVFGRQALAAVRAGGNPGRFCHDRYRRPFGRSPDWRRR